MAGEYFLQKTGAGVQLLSEPAVLAQLKDAGYAGSQGNGARYPCCGRKRKWKKHKGAYQVRRRQAQPGGSCEGQGDEEHEYGADSPGFPAACSQGVLVFAVKLSGVLHVFLHGFLISKLAV